MADDYKKLEELIKFPSVVGFRVIVDSTVVNSIGEIKKVVDAIEKDGMQDDDGSSNAVGIGICNGWMRKAGRAKRNLCGRR